MEQTLFYVFGIALVLSALAVSALGLRLESFPPSRGMLAGIVLYFAALVAATTTFAVLNAADEQSKRQADQAQAATQPASGGGTTTSTTPATTTTTTTSGAPQGGGGTVKLAADPTGQLAYQQQALSTTAGAVTIDFDNPSPVGHDVCLESSSGDELGCSDIVTSKSTTLTADLQAGKYTFYCSVPGHRDAGMEGTLTAQ